MPGRDIVRGVVALAIGVAGTLGAQAQEIRAEAQVQPAPAVALAAKARRALPVHVANATLAPPELAAYPKALLAPTKTGVPLQVGFGRSVVAFQTAAATASNLAWDTLGDGSRVAALSVTSPDAAAVRMGVGIERMPEGARLRFYAPDSETAYEVSGAQVAGTVQRNLASGASGAAALQYWSPVVEGATIVMEVELPPGAATDAVRLSVPMVSHLLTSASSDFAMPKLTLSCEHDVMCYQATWGSESNAEARMVFTSGGSSFVCSGTLVADKDGATFIPYFLSANHCIDNQLDASSLETYWFYRSTACNSGVRAASVTLSGGATLLYASATTDTSFMRLNSPPPAGAVYAGWVVGATPDPGTAVTGIHYPSGGLQKISFGSVVDYWSCSASVDEHFTCDSAAGPAASFYGIQWNTGITEPGSSGSGLFRDNGHYLVGQLYGGSSSCTGTASDFYGRFDIAYNAALYQWLGNAASAAPTAPVAAPALDYTDLWWNPAQSGWGLAITQHDARLFAAWYLYDDAGNPLWAVIPGGQWSAPNVFSGDIYTATGPDPTGAFDPARVVRTPVGSASLTFNGAGSAVLSYRMNGVFEARSIERQPFGVPNAPASPTVGDMWWNAAESGWGISISQQFGTLFAVWYTYLPSGAPAWYVMPGGSWNASGTYTGTLYRTQYAQRPFLGASFDPGAVTRIPAGSLSIHFMDANSAFMTYSIGAVSGTKAITRQPF